MSKKTKNVDQKLATRCSLIDETMKVVKNSALPEVDFELQVGIMSFLDFFTKKTTLFRKTNYSLFLLIKGYQWAKNERIEYWTW